VKSFAVTPNSLDTDWMSSAACRGRTDLFFPATGGNHSAEVKAVCASCPVRSECLAYARALPEPPEGIWGGLAGAELRRGAL
jgi:WhiB family transcriptional regulator, redox-sensing transcriptional regulator